MKTKIVIALGVNIFDEILTRFYTLNIHWSMQIQLNFIMEVCFVEIY